MDRGFCKINYINIFLCKLVIRYGFFVVYMKLNLNDE